MVQVAARSGLAATGCGTGWRASHDEVLEEAAGLIARLAMPVIAATPSQGADGDGEAAWWGLGEAGWAAGDAAVPQWLGRRRQ